MTIKGAMIARGICSCGRGFMIFQPEKRDLAERMTKDLEGMDWDIFVNDQPVGYCSKCGQSISLLTPEALDNDRHGLDKLIDELESKQHDQADTDLFS